MPEISKATAADFDELVETADIAFTRDDRGYFTRLLPKLYKRDTFDPSAHYIIRDSRGIAALVGSFPAQVSISGTVLPLSGIGTVCVAERCRHNGYMKLLMNAACEDMRAAGTAYALLGGRRQRYEYFGFTPAGCTPTFEFTADNARHCYPGDNGYTFEEITSVSDRLPQMLALHDARAFHFIRTPDTFFDTLCSWYSHPVAVIRDGVTEGYFVSDREGGSINELVLRDPLASGKVLADYLRAFGRDSVRVGGALLGEECAAGADTFEGFNIHCACNVRVFDYAATVGAYMKYKSMQRRLPDGRLSFAVTGAGSFTVEVKNGVPAVCRSSEPDALRLAPLEATRLFFSYAASLKPSSLPPIAEAWFPLPLTVPASDKV